MKWILTFCIIASVVLLLEYRSERDYKRGVADTQKKLLSLTPPSEALELACVTLWVNEQNKKYQEKDNAR
jgi:hypothetical protein